MTTPDTRPADTPSPAVQAAPNTVLTGFFPRPTVESTVAPPSKTVAPPQENFAGEPPNFGFYNQSDVSDAPPADAHCIRCGTGMTGDEAALNKKYLGRHVTSYLCPACLGERLGLSTDDLHHMIDVFRRQGCRLFSPMEL